MVHGRKRRTKMRLLQGSAVAGAGLLLLIASGCETEPEEEGVREGAPVAQAERVPPSPPVDEELVEERSEAAAERQQEPEGERQPPQYAAAWRMERQQAQEGEDGTVMLTLPAPDGSDGLAIRRQYPDEVRAGQTIEYTIEVENISDNPMHQIVIEEWRGQGFDLEVAQVLGGEQRQQRAAQIDQPQNQQGQQQQGQQQQGEQQQGEQQQGQQMQAQSRQQMGQADSQWRIGSLMPGESRTIVVEGVAPEEGSIRTCMAASYEPTVCLTMAVVQPELRLLRQVEMEGGFAYICDPVEVTYLVENSGSAAANDLELVEELPQGVTTADGESTVRFTIGELPAGETMERSVMLRAEQPGEYTSFATLTSEASKVRSRKQPVRFLAPQLDIRVDAPSQEYVGRDVPVRVAVRNTSNVPAMETAIRINDLQALSRVSLSTQEAQMEGDVIEIGRLNPGETRELTVMFYADQPMEMSLNAAATAYCADVVTDEVGLQLRGIEAVRLETIDLVDPVIVGEETVYEVTVKNQGTADSINVKVNATLPEQMTFVGGEGDSQVQGQGRDVTLSAIPRLRPGDLATWRIRARAEGAGKTRLQLELTSDATRRPIREQESTTVVPPAQGAQRDQQRNQDNQGG
jgi:uncharacterized repeat protein (TIGR01451 family)